MRTFSILGAAVLTAGVASAQQALNEQFDYSSSSAFPPSGWSAVDNGTAPVAWEEPSLGLNIYTIATLTVDTAAHAYTGQGIQAESYLESPAFDLTSYGSPELSFDSDVYWTQYMAHHPSTLANGASFINVSTDGGSTWSQVWTEGAIVDGFTPGVAVDLASVAGQSSVMLQFHYSGDYAHEWGVDNVVVDNGGAPTGPSLSTTGPCPGPGTLDGAGFTAGGVVGVAWSLQGGAWTIPGGPVCVGTTLDIVQPQVLLTVPADASGGFSVMVNKPAAVCGNVTLQALDFATCAKSNTMMP